ncbi:MAG: glycosyltransferase family 4 protein [Verrucomicrobia bacterium]|jgi:glycosyltransferase involved in cell wall biosynthesis|nr:glycosyltransferase family 4 protein [Verrucomicrobiota bacterium]OQC67452.1 MAG: Glycosyl transferases group 1 [Verrucomicrobia bacterium ADurb.Bin006]MDI9380449.1 glycosyltransferase family 4 protein [Verrucomicrobiota bacterium]NMD18861.1 glycosyltransferase family 4 protein [Verrucomicrobiota bacterium]HNU99528.1 glycosyltransferase family 4 protein [Verrucomicrobiota bacterium]
MTLAGTSATRHRMRLALLTHEPLHPPTGGGSAEALYLVREFVRRGHDVHVFCPTVPEADRLERDLGVRLHPFTLWRMGRYASLRSLKYLVYPLFLERLVARVAREIRFDVLFSQHAISAVAAGRLKRRLGAALVMNQLDYLTGFMETWPAWLMPPPLLALLMRYELSLPRRFGADRVLTVSDALADRVAAAGFPRERLESIYYGYDSALFPFDAAAVAARSDDPPVVVMHGSFDRHHLGPIALEAVAHVRAERPDTVFRFVGQPTDTLRSFLEAARKRGAGGGVECPGFVPYREMARHLAGASVGIVPYEASAGVHCAFVAKVVEYLALGLPVVCTALEGIQRYFPDEPLIRYARFQGRHFGEQILAWLRTPLAERRKMSQPASLRVACKLDWSVICRRAADAVEDASRSQPRANP